MSVTRWCAVVLGASVLAAGSAGAGVAQAAAPWLAPEPFAPPVATKAIGATSTAMTPGGTGLLGADRYDGNELRSVVSTRPPGPSVGGPETLSSTAPILFGSVRVALDPQGDATAAWLGVDPADASRTMVEAALRPAGGSWSTPQVVRTGAVDQGSLALAAGAGSRAVVAWTERDAAVGERVWTAKRPSGEPAFAVALPLSPAGAPGDAIYLSPVVAVDAAGDYVATWQRYHDYGNGLRYVDEAVAVDSSGVTGTVEQLTSTTAGSAGGMPSATIAPNGRALFAGDYSDGTSDAIGITELVPGATFGTSTYQSLPSLGTAPSLTAAHVALEPGGGAVLSWARGSIVVCSARVSPLSAFSTPKDVSGPSSATESVLAVGPSGDALLAWPVRTATTTTLVAARRRPGSDAFSEVGAVTEATGPTGGSASFAHLSLAVDDAGDGLLSAVRDVKDAEAVHTYTPEVVGFDAAPPAVTASVPSSATVGQAVPFRATAVDRLSASTSAWDFGDGGTATGATPTHAFAAPGTYAVRVTATDGGRNTAAATGSVRVVAAPPATTGTVPAPPPATPAPSPATPGTPAAVPPPSQPGTGPVPPAAPSPVAPAASFPLVGARVVLATTRLRGGRTRIDALRVDRLRRGDRIALRCTGGGCRATASRTVTFRRRTGSRQSLTTAVAGLRLVAGAELSVGVSRARSTARTVTFTMVRRRAPARSQRCLDPGATRQRRC